MPPRCRMPKEDAGQPSWSGRESALAASAKPEIAGGFEIIDDEEDEIIELE